MVDIQLAKSNANENQSSQQIRELCTDVLEKAKEFTKEFDFRIEPKSGAVEYWENYRTRLETYDRNFNYPRSVNPVKCAIKGWTYLNDGIIQCVECQETMQLTIPDENLNNEKIDQASLEILKGLRAKHDSLCSFHAAFHHSIILHSVPNLLKSIKENITPQLFKSEEIDNELANLCHVTMIDPSFALYFAVAGWFVRENRTLFCKMCLQTVNPAEQGVMNPLKLHYDYCPILESYPQWKLALEDYVYSNSNPKSISENFALIRRQLANIGLPSKVPIYEPLRDVDADEEMPSIHEGTEAGTLDLNRTLESMHEANNQSVDIESAQLRDTDFEAEIQQESLNRKRARRESSGDSPLAKRILPFPHNYLEAYGQPTENVIPIVVPIIVPIPIDNQLNEQLLSVPVDNQLSESSMDMQYERELSIDEPGPSDLQEDSNSDLSSEAGNEAEAVGHEILAEQEIDRLPLHEGGEREVEDSGDDQSADERESYDDDGVTTDEEKFEENIPYDEPEEFADNSSGSEEVANDSKESNDQVESNNWESEQVNESDKEKSHESDGEDFYEDYSDIEEDEIEEAQEDNNDSDSDIIVLD